MERIVLRFPRPAVLAVLVVTILLTWMPVLDDVAQTKIDEGINRALVTFGAAKALNGAVSVLQSTQFSAQPLGVGLAFTVGEALDPLNDLAERFSTFMLTAAVAFGVQKVLLSVGGDTLVKLLLSLVVALWGWMYLRKAAPPPRWLSTAFVLLLMVRFAVPIVTVSTEAVFNRFLAAQYNDSDAVIRRAQDEVSSMTPDVPAAGGPDEAQESATQEAETATSGFSPFEWFGERREDMGEVIGKINVKELMAGYTERATKLSDRVTSNVVDLIVVFLLHTLIIPLAMLWAMYKGVAIMLTRPALAVALHE